MDLDNQKAHPVDAAVEQKRARALELRIAGKSYRKIAETMRAEGHEVGKSQAHLYVTEALDELKADNAQSADELRAVEVERLDEILASLWDKRDNPRTADTILRVSERRARLLGLDAPTKWEGSGPGGGPIPIRGDIDLTNLTLEQLKQLEAIVASAHAPVATIGAPAETKQLEPGPAAE